MSAFLGPIHISMYQRVLYQDEISQCILALAEEQGWAAGLREQVDSKAPAASKKPLEEIIDQGNIHGWLSKAVAVSENRFALIVSSVLDNHPQRLDQLKDAMKKLGQQHQLPATHHAEQVFKNIHTILLDGMPCDFPFSVTESDEAQVIWQVASCPHSPYWDATGGDVEAYYLLRDAWVEGALENSGLVHTRSSGKHTLRKEV